MQQDIDGAEPRMLRAFLDFHGRALEVGCGDGRATVMLAASAGCIVAIDPDSDRVKKARKGVPGAEFALGVGERACFRDGSFGAVAFTYSLHHVDAPKALSEASRLLRPGGQLVVVEPAIEGEIMRFFELFKDEAAELGRAREALAASGFVMERREAFRSRWSFRDREDLLDYYFKGAPERGADTVRKIDGLLGERAADAPIILADESWICSMRKPG